MPSNMRLKINGEQRTAISDAERPLLDVLREDFQLTGTKYGCGEGECGACTVLVDGVPTRSCITSVADVIGAEIETIEGLAQDGVLHEVQQAFVDHQAMQCGFCIPGHIMTAVALFRDKSNTSREQMLASMSEHICRCCNYENIRSAVEQSLFPK